MSLTSTSTLANALAQYNNNLSWEGDATKAAAALEAVRWLLVNRAQNISTEGRTINYASLEKEKEKLEAFVSISSTTTAAKRSSFTRGRCLRD